MLLTYGQRSPCGRPTSSRPEYKTPVAAGALAAIYRFAAPTPLRYVYSRRFPCALYTSLLFLADYARHQAARFLHPQSLTYHLMAIFLPRVHVSFSSCSSAFPLVRIYFILQSFIFHYLRLASLIVLHSLVAVRYRIWWLIPTACLAGGGEIVGWAGRLWSSENVTAHTPFTMQ